MAGVALTLGLYRAGRVTTDIPVWRMIATTVGAAGSSPTRWRHGSAGRSRSWSCARPSAVGRSRRDPAVGGSRARRASPTRAWLRPSAAGRGRSSAGSRTVGSSWTCGPWTSTMTASWSGPWSGPSPPPHDRRRRHGQAHRPRQDHALRASGIDADRLPEERRRGMTIDVGYAHLTLDDGTVIDFVDVPGHDKLVGNMLVGAGEIDAALLVVAADDGPAPRPSSTWRCSTPWRRPDRRCNRHQDRRGRRGACRGRRSCRRRPAGAHDPRRQRRPGGVGTTADGLEAVRVALAALGLAVQLPARPRCSPSVACWTDPRRARHRHAAGRWPWRYPAARARGPRGPRPRDPGPERQPIAWRSAAGPR